MKNSMQLLYTGLLLAGTLTVPVAAQTLSSETAPDSETGSAAVLISQVANAAVPVMPLDSVAASDQVPDAVVEDFITPVSPQAEAVPAKSHNDPAFVQLDDSEQAQTDPMSQVTNVSQLRDVQPTDWAFEALRSLVERYGCIAGYPDGTFRGNRALSRYEFAAGLNACLAQIDILIQSNQRIPLEELNTLDRLTTEFTTELALLRANVDAIQARTGELEATQFSTTTKLYGQAVVGVQGRNENEADFSPVDGVQDTEDPGTSINLITNVQLNLLTQFSPGSLLLTGLQSGNGSTAPRLTNNTRLGYEDDTNNDLRLSDLRYRQLIGEKFAFIVGPEGVNAVNVFRGRNRVESAGFGPLSAFAQRNPIISIGAGRGGVGFDWQISDRVSLQGVYSASLPEDSNSGGIFGGDLGDTSTGLQLDFAATNTIDLTLNYINAYSPSGSLRTGIGDDQLTAGDALKTNAFGATVAWRVTPGLTLGSWGGYTTSGIPGESGNVETTNWMVFLNFPDLLGEGNLGGIYVGQPPKIVSSDLPIGQNIPDLLAGGEGDSGGQPGTTTHVELFYRYRLSTNITITPGVIVIFNPANTPDNDTITIGGIRTTLTF